MRRRGFTLIELSVVLALMVMMVAVASYSVKGPYEKAKFGHTLREIKKFDSAIRSVARGQEIQLVLEIDIKENRLRAWEMGRETGFRREYKLPPGIEIVGLETSLRLVKYGQVSMRVSSAGSTPTYALSLESPQGRTTSLLFHGITGQSKEAEDEEDVKATFRMLLSARVNTY